MKNRKRLLQFRGDFKLFPNRQVRIYMPTRAIIIVVQSSTWLRYRRPNNKGASQAKGDDLTSSMPPLVAWISGELSLRRNRSEKTRHSLFTWLFNLIVPVIEDQEKWHSISTTFQKTVSTHLAKNFFIHLKLKGIHNRIR